MATRPAVFSQSEQYRKGDVSQRLCTDFFKRRGWYVIPSYDYHGGDEKPPRMDGPGGAFCLPDLDVCRNGTRRWVEVKYKKRATWYRNGRQLEHGINLWLFNHHYKRVCEQSGDELYIAIHEGATDRLLVRKADELRPLAREYHGGGMGRAGMVFFPRSQLQGLAVIPIPNPEPGIVEVRALVTELRRLGPLTPDHDKCEWRCAGRPLTMTERALLWREREVAMTLLHDLDLLPWFGEIGEPK